MGTLLEALREAGIEAEGNEPLGVRGDLARLARLVRQRRARTLGLAPADDRTAIPQLAIALGRSLALAAAAPVAVLDTCGSWPCASGLLDVAGSDVKLVALNWLSGRVALLTPRPAAPGEVMVLLHDAIQGAARGFSHLIVDLTGLSHIGASVGAYDLLDATVLVARAGRTAATGLSRSLREIPESRRLGVLLTGL